MAEFLGLQMVVTLRSPPERLKGVISAVDPGESLTLQNVWLLDTKGWQPTVKILVSNIVEIVDASVASNTAPAVPAQAPAAAQKGPVLHQSTPQPAPQPVTAGTSSFADPAILSFNKKPATARPVQPVGQDGASYNQQQKVAENRSTLQAQQPMGNVTILPRHPAVVTAPSAVTAPSIVLDPAMAKLSMEAKPTAQGPDPSQLPMPTTQESLHPKRNRRKKRPPHQAGAEDNVEQSPTAAHKSAGRGKGWRQTPMLQSTSSFQPFDSLKPRRSGRGRTPLGQDNGWASEDVTDVQELGDYDFERELAKFDKNTVFSQLRQEDEVDEADRLVSHNRLSNAKPLPGTAGGKNLHYSENVLDKASLPPSASKPVRSSPIVGQDFWNSEAEIDGGERASGRDLGSRQSSRRADSKVSTTRRSQSRKASAANVGNGPIRINSGLGSDPLGRRSRSRAASPKMDPPRGTRVPSSGAAQCFHLLPSHRRLDTVSALQMLNLENIAHNELGLTEDMMSENAGRGIAEVALIALRDPAIKLRLGAAANNSPSMSSKPGAAPSQTVVVLAGNNKSGIRAIAGARHLRNKGVTVLVCVVGIERGERDLLEDMRQQLRLFRNFGGQVLTKTALFEHLRKVSIPTLTIDTPRNAINAKPPIVTLIIDALLGLAISFDELRTGDQATVYELIEWSNRNEAFVLAVDVPTGIDPSSGKASVVDGNKLYVRPRYVVAIGAPKRGLLETMMGAGQDRDDAGPAGPADDPVEEWKLYVADMGLAPAVFKKAGTRSRRGIDFDDKWVLQMQYQGIGQDDEYV